MVKPAWLSTATELQATAPSYEYLNAKRAYGGSSEVSHTWGVRISRPIIGIMLKNNGLENAVNFEE
jgi:hypothetical protein